MHGLAIRSTALLGQVPVISNALRAHYAVEDPRLASEIAGLRFNNPIGLAAGYDKNGTAIRGLAAFGFGFVEIGSVSAEFSAGNPKPRLFRLPGRDAIVVHYGLPNLGAQAVSVILERNPLPIPLGINIVKTNRGPDHPGGDDVIGDYVESVRTLKDAGDYLMLNLSCPNTENGRDFFSDIGEVTTLLEQIRELNVACPVFLKISPCGGDAWLDTLLEAVDPFDYVSGFMFNLPPGKPPELGLSPEQIEAMPGAVAGKPIEAHINACVASLYRRMDRQRYRIMAAGGVFTAEDAYRKVRLGASLVQLLTGLIYRGPGVVRDINRGLLALLERDGVANIRDAVGVDIV
jgi:dihydroorotate dehydrogenase (fumarate)/dihydroorotate dehydrogenase